MYYPVATNMLYMYPSAHSNSSLVAPDLQGTVYGWDIIKQILTAFTGAMVKTTMPSVIPGAFHRPRDHLGCHCFHHSTSISSQYVLTSY